MSNEIQNQKIRNQKIARGLALFSGGLDSILAAKILQKQGIEILPLCFESGFFSADKARVAALENNLPLRVVDISEKHLAIVKKPKHGWGAGANPCIDCHLLMLAVAKKIMEDEGFDFAATGEVLGQRPMSQNKLSLEIIERESGLAGRLLRPLSAKILPETEVEKKGLIDRSRLYAISGRSRRAQLKLAQDFGIKNIPQPAGGCILTEPEYGRRLKELMVRFPDFGVGDARILRHGRSFWEGDLLVVVARDKNECAALKKSAKAGDFIFEPQNFPGPTVIVRPFGKKIGRGETSTNSTDLSKIEKTGREYVSRYSKKIPPNPLISAVEIDLRWGK